MNLVNQLTAVITGKEDLSACSIEELQQLVRRHPAFGPGHLLLAKKLEGEDSSAYRSAIDTLSLYVPNPLWLTNLLSGEADGVEPVEHPIESIQPLSSDDFITAEQERPFTKEEVVVQAEPKNVAPIEAQSDNEEVVETVEEGQPELTIRIPELRIEPIDPETAELSFEPYHTVDYFASQGILVREEERPKDRFSEQLKSFTDWLKTIKKVPVTEIVAASTASDERKVEQMAEKSITDREVVTEAMAEVWEKQGDRSKAAAIYRKLSLLDPAKSSYFAAKIEHLKQ